MEDWKKEILARDALDAYTCISYIANMLYPEISMAKERESKLRLEGGKIIEDLESKCILKYNKIKKELDEDEGNE